MNRLTTDWLQTLLPVEKTTCILYVINSQLNWSLQVGAHIYAKATFIIFIIVMTVLASIFISFFIVGPVVVILSDASVLNSTGLITSNYTGLRLHTLEGNLLRKCCSATGFD